MPSSTELTAAAAPLIPGAADTKDTSPPAPLSVNSLFFSPYAHTREEMCVKTLKFAQGHFDKDLRVAIADEKFVVKHPLLAYRADARHPYEIFRSGFSAHAISRLNANICFMTQCGCAASLLTWLCCCPLACIACMCADPSCGQSIYNGAGDTNRNALSLTPNPNHALPAYSREEQAYLYIVYMDGCIQFSEFIKAKYPEKIGKEHDMINEILPLDLNDQVVGNNRVIAAQVLDVNYNGPGEPVFCERSKWTYFNPQFAGWHRLAVVLETHKLEVKDFQGFKTIKECQLNTAEQITEILHAAFPELKVVSPDKPKPLPPPAFKR